MGANINLSVTTLGDKIVPIMNDRRTLNENEVVNEAIELGYCIGKTEQILFNVKGILQSMKRGVEKDGNGRRIDAYCSVQPALRAKLADITDELDKSTARVKLHARLLGDRVIDTSDWTITIDGSTGSIVIKSITTGEEIGVVYAGSDIDLNGTGLKMGAGDSITWRVPEAGKSGTVAAEYITSDSTRITLNGAAFLEIDNPAYNGMLIEFTVKIGNNIGVKSATLHCE